MALELSKSVSTTRRHPAEIAASPKDKDIVFEAVKVSTVPAVGLTLENVDKSYGDRKVLFDVNLSLSPGEFCGIVGQSGCGKSTLLRLIAGLERPDSGEIRVDGKPITGLNIDSRFMFQDARLIPWKRVRENVALGLKTANRMQRAEFALSQVGLLDRGRDRPGVLSGGQKQRVALARALVNRPPLLLLDEPLGALDALTRLEMQSLIGELQAERGFTALLVTHDIEEAVALCDRVILLERGRIASDIAVPTPRPRQRDTIPFVAMKAELLTRLMSPFDTFDI